MSWEDRFYLPRRPIPVDVESIEERVRSIVGAEAEVEGAELDGVVTIRTTFVPERVERLARRLGQSARGWLDYDWRVEIDTPRDLNRYVVVLELVDTAFRSLRLAAAVKDNHAAWPLAFALCGRLAEQLDAPSLRPRR